MCFRQEKTPTPQPLTPAPPPPTPPAPPLPTPEPLTTDVNPQVRRARSKKDKNPMSQGTGALRIPLKNTVNTGSSTPAGGLNL